MIAFKLLVPYIFFLPIRKITSGLKIEVVCFISSFGSALLTVKLTIFNEKFKLYLWHK